MSTEMYIKAALAYSILLDSFFSKIMPDIDKDAGKQAICHWTHKLARKVLQSNVAKYIKSHKRR